MFTGMSLSVFTGMSFTDYVYRDESLWTYPVRAGSGLGPPCPWADHCAPLSGLSGPCHSPKHHLSCIYCCSGKLIDTPIHIQTHTAINMYNDLYQKQTTDACISPRVSVSVCIIQLSCYQTLFDVGCKGYFSVRVRILSMSSDSLKSFLGRARCSISLLQTTLTLLSLAILNKRSTVYKISCTKCTYSQNVFNTLKAVKINVLYYIVKKNRFIHLLFLKGQSKSKRES